MTASEKCQKLAKNLHSKSNRIPYEDVYDAATHIAQCASNTLTVSVFDRYLFDWRHVPAPSRPLTVLCKNEHECSTMTSRVRMHFLLIMMPISNQHGRIQVNVFYFTPQGLTPSSICVQICLPMATTSPWKLFRKDAISTVKDDQRHRPPRNWLRQCHHYPVHWTSIWISVKISTWIPQQSLCLSKPPPWTLCPRNSSNK